MEWFISQNHSPFLQECPEFLLSQLCHPCMSHCISAWFPKTGGRSFSHAISLSFSHREVTAEQNGSLSNKLKEKQASTVFIISQGYQSCVKIRSCGMMTISHTDKHTLHLSCLLLPFLENTVLCPYHLAPCEVRRNVARCPPSQVLEYILRCFSRRMKHWQKNQWIN